MLQELLVAVAARAEAERHIATEFSQGTDNAEEAFFDATNALSTWIDNEKQRLKGEHDERVNEIGANYVRDKVAIQGEYDHERETIQRAFEEAAQEAKEDYDEGRWMVQSVFDDEADDSPGAKFEAYKANIIKTKDRLKTEWEDLEETQGAAIKLLQHRRQWDDYVIPDSKKKLEDAEDSLELFDSSVDEVHQQFMALQKQKLPLMFIGWRPFMAVMVPTLAFGSLPFFFLDPRLIQLNLDQNDPVWLALGAGVVCLIFTIFVLTLFYKSKKKGAKCFVPMQQAIASAKTARRYWQKYSKEDLDERHKEYQRWYKATVAKRDANLQKADDKYAQRLADLEEQKKADTAAIDEKYPAQLQDLEDRRNRELEEAGMEHKGLVDEVVNSFDSESGRLNGEHDRHMSDFRTRYESEWSEMTNNWVSTLNNFAAVADEMLTDSEEAFLPWSEIQPGELTLPETIPQAIRIGLFDVALEDIEGGLPEDDRLMPERSQFTTPALLPFPDSPSLLLKANGIGRDAAVYTIQSTMLRMLTSLPAGKVRFTVFDPVGLGENFSMFMHLADYDELMINNRIWTEPAHIEQRLTDLTEHMENVFQKYLRNEFGTIQEYNVHAGEVAEPYQILVVANFPHNFSDAAARRLVSIASSGARCGVYTLVSVDTKQRLPMNFDLEDLEAHATVLAWEDDQFIQEDEDYEWLPLSLDPPPNADQFTEIIKAAGRESKDARRVEVAFSRIAPKEDKLWTMDSRAGLDVPLGRAGATKLQHMRLGCGTSQHVLIAGKTGSGKSSFLHALITNAALHYSADELQFFLIDFKKGVEFKTYASHELPHARVIAIESDREFGVSVLERLDTILKERGELFRDMGVQDIRAYRDQNPDAVLPRMLLIIDEFQEFFVEDDKYSQSAALLLDRLVRQGRAFGIHVMLGSQTLGGAYSLARSTMGQVAVRIALQCSESDAHLILSEENTAARLLTRPGEAIYNDANGMVEGNNPFQIAWLDEDRREEHLARMQELTTESGLDVTPAIVFEGNVPANPLRNSELLSLVSAAEPPESLLYIRGWLGEAVAITGATSVIFRRQSGMNLLVAGQSIDSALGIMTTMAISFAAQHINADWSGTASTLPTFYILDGTYPEEPEYGYWQRTADALPQNTDLIDQRRAGQVVTSLGEEVTRRENAAGEDHPPLFLVIFNLGRFRDLRREEDDYSFSSYDKDKPTSSSKHLADILKNGPAVGVHTLIWCDTSNNLSRWLGRESQRELEIRVIFQMSANDSSNLIDSPAGGKLGPNRALLYLEEQGTLEKFRPYGLPSDEWLENVATAFAPRRVETPAVATSDVDQSTDDPSPAAPKNDGLEEADDINMWSVS